MTRHKASISWFAIIGAAAALVHYITAVSLEGLNWLPAAHANIAGFLAAFPVSYFGHRFLSFAHLNAQSSPSTASFF